MAQVGFDKLKAMLAARPGVTDPGGLARTIGEKKYTKPGFAALEAAGRAKRKASAMFKAAKK